MTGKKLNYVGDDIVVGYDVKRCIHAAACVSGLPAAFDPKRKPWIDASAADADEIAGVIRSCPSGALTYARMDGEPEEETPPANIVRVEANGPLFVSGDIEIRAEDGSELFRETRAALCRCGHSANKPFCDNTHNEISFNDSGCLGKGGVKVVDGNESKSLVVKLATDGPLLLTGEFSVVATDDESRSGNKTALCRCGQSENRPFCDGSHRNGAFRS